MNYYFIVIVVMYLLVLVINVKDYIVEKTQEVRMTFWVSFIGTVFQILLVYLSTKTGF